MDNSDRIWILMARSLSGEATQNEADELLACFKRDPVLYQQYQLMRKLWGIKSGEDLVVEEEATERVRLKSILRKAEKERTDEAEDQRGGIWRSLLGGRMQLLYAALIAFVVIIFYYPGTRSGQTVKKKEEVVSVQNGSRTKILLPDGTNVWLNGDSKLYYDASFNGKFRKVRLVGEAFFDVAKKPNQPFIVYAGKINIKVLGTAFNVKCYEDDKDIETTLLRGSIEVTENTSESRPRILLKPNQKLIVPVEPVSLLMPEKDDFKILNLDKKLKEDEHIETSWVYNRVEFRGEDFEELARKLERWYDIKIVFEDEEVKGIKFNGSFEKETVEEAFNALQRVASFKFKINGREVFIKSSQ